MSRAKLPQRTRIRVDLLPGWEERLARKACPVCGLERVEFWKRKTKVCCSPACEAVYQGRCVSEDTQKPEVWQRAGGRCAWCGADLSARPFGHAVDHIVPIGLGGEEFDLENQQLLCEKCNKEKTRRDQEALALVRRVVSLREAVRARAGGRCEQCAGSLEGDGALVPLVPLSQGGSETDASNHRLVCPACASRRAREGREAALVARRLGRAS